jgi:hypothetical protein
VTSTSINFAPLMASIIASPQLAPASMSLLAIQLVTFARVRAAAIASTAALSFAEWQMKTSCPRSDVVFRLLLGAASCGMDVALLARRWR